MSVHPIGLEAPPEDAPDRQWLDWAAALSVARLGDARLWSRVAAAYARTWLHVTDHGRTPEERGSDAR